VNTRADLQRAPYRLAAVVLNYRTPAATVRAVRALEASSRMPDLVVVVDNGSGDESADILRADLPRAVLLALDDNRGFAGGCNVGIRQALDAGADAVLLVNSDLIVTKSCVQTLCGAMEDQDVGIAGPAIVNAGDEARLESAGLSYNRLTGRMRQRDHGRLASLAGEGIAAVDAVSGAAMLVARDVFDRIGLLAEEYFFGFEDLDFCLRARAAGVRVAVVAGARALHEGSASIGSTSPRRLYFAARNHLLLASRIAPSRGATRLLRPPWIVALNLAHAVTRAGVPVVPGVLAVLRGTRDHLRARYGNCG
jgi:GT2 family glycosyltransferase